MLTETSSLPGLNDGFTSSLNSRMTLDGAIALARSKLLSLQNEQGYWIFELEADCTIPSEYILMMH